MALDFPSPATPGQVYTAAGKSWVYDASFGWLSTQSSNPAAQYIAKVVCVGGETSINFANIPQNFTELELVWSVRDTAAGTGTSNTRLKFNNDATSGNYPVSARSGSASGTYVGNTVAATALGAALGFHCNDGNVAGVFANGSVIIPHYTNAAILKRFIGAFGETDISNGECVFVQTGRWLSFAAVNQLTIGTDGTAFKAGSSATLYGRGAVATSPAVYESSTAPGTPYAGMLWWKSDEGTLKIYYNGAWIDASSLSAGSVGGGMTRIAKVVTSGSAATIAFAAIPQTFSELRLVLTGRDTASGIGSSYPSLRINGDSTSGNYTSAQYMQGIAGSVFAGTDVPSSVGAKIGILPGTSSDATALATITVTLPEYAGTVFQKMVSANCAAAYSLPLVAEQRAWKWKSTAPITDLLVTAGTTAFVDGTAATLYGMG